MPAWLHRTKKQYLRSIAFADLPEASTNYIENPDLSAITGQPNKYWIITGDVVTLMDQAALDAIDAVEVETQRDNVVAQLDHQEDLLRAFASIMVDELNILRAEQKPVLPPRTLAQLKTAMRNKLGL